MEKYPNFKELMLVTSRSLHFFCGVKLLKIIRWRQHTYIILVLAQKKIKIQNNADLTRNSAPLLASFLVKSALFCIFIFFSAKTSIIYVCGGI